jgi:hypothetical protein
VTLNEFAAVVAQMRRTQRAFSRSERNEIKQALLVEARIEESKVDKMVAQHEREQAILEQQTQMFESEENCVADAVLREMLRRKGFDAWWDGIEDDTQQDIRDSLRRCIQLTVMGVDEAEQTEETPDRR